MTNETAPNACRLQSESFPFYLLVAQTGGGEVAVGKAVLIYRNVIPLSYRSPKTEIRESKIHGRGLFAASAIEQNEIVAVKGGHIVNRRSVAKRDQSEAWAGGNPN